MTDNSKSLAAYGVQDGYSLHLVKREPRLQTADASRDRPGTSSDSARPAEGQAETHTRGRNMVVGNIPVERTSLFQNPHDTLVGVEKFLIAPVA